MRGLRLGVALCLLGAALVLVGCAVSWGHVTVDSPPLPVHLLSVHGGSVAPGLRALGILGALGVLGIAATRGPGRRLVGLVVLGAGVGATVSAALWLRGGELRRALRDTGRHCSGVCGSLSSGLDASLTSHPSYWGVLLALAGGLLLLAAGVLAVVRGGTWNRLGSSYEAPGATAPEPETDKGVWDALDRGDDPTA